MKTVALGDTGALARQAAAFMAGEARKAVQERGRFLLALSGGSTPAGMLDRLAAEDVPWSRVHLFQVDERIVEAAHPARSLTLLQAHLLDKVSIPLDQVHPMPVEAADLAAAAMGYAALLNQMAGDPPVLDLVHLGLGEDGHTASLIPGDPVLNHAASTVALTGLYRGFKRMTLTYPALSPARLILWLVTGPAKAGALARFCSGDSSIPAGRLPTDRAILFTDATWCLATEPAGDRPPGPKWALP